MSFDDLLNIALVGTSRQPPKLQAADGALGGAIAFAGSLAPEEQLLAAAAIFSNFELCGALADASEKLPEPSATDARPQCSARAGQLLDQLLAMTNTPTKQSLLELWLAGADRTGKRVPHASLPALFEYGTTSRDIRVMISAVVDHRGQWLIAQNPRWSFTTAKEEDVERIWSTGNREQRVSAIRRYRATHPVEARKLIESTWKEDGADERAAFVEAMVVGIADADEPLLEAALDDRSKQVRAAAADVLAALPNSAMVKRMIERVEPLLAFTPPAKGGLIKRAKPGQITVTLPADNFDPELARDGITEKPEDRLGRRQWWLLQMLRAVPPAHWTSKWGQPAGELVAASDGEFGDLLLRGWVEAAKKYRDTEWAEALAAAFVFNDRGALPVSLIGQLSAQMQQEIAVHLFKSSKLNTQQILAVLESLSHELSPETVNVILESIRQDIKKAQNYSYMASAMIERLSFKVPTAMHDQLATALTQDEWSFNRKAVDTFLQVLLLRREIQREFAA